MKNEIDKIQEKNLIGILASNVCKSLGLVSNKKSRLFILSLSL